MTNIPFLIGKSSDNSSVRQDLLDMQHLFISYLENEQYHRLVADAIKDLGRKREELYFATAVSKECYTRVQHLMFNEPVARHFIKMDEHSASKQQFIRSLLTLLKYRQKNYMATGQPPARIIILIEDVFDLIIPDKKGVGNQFLQLLLQGPAYGMHMIIGSIRTYRNLLTQLIHLDLHPRLRKQFGDVFNSNEPLGAELILNADDLVFYKSRQDFDYRRYFASSEGERKMLDVVE